MDVRLILNYLAELVCKLNDKIYKTRLTSIERMNGFNIHLSEMKDSTGDMMPVIEMYPEELLEKLIRDNKFILDYDIRSTTILPWPKYEKRHEGILGQPLPTREIEQRILRVCNGDQRKVFSYWYDREPHIWKFDSILMFDVSSKAGVKGAMATQDTFRSLTGAIGFSATTSVNMEIGQVLVCPNKMPQKIDMLKRVQFFWPRN